MFLEFGLICLIFGFQTKLYRFSFILNVAIYCIKSRKTLIFNNNEFKILKILEKKFILEPKLLLL